MPIKNLVIGIVCLIVGVGIGAYVFKSGSILGSATNCTDGYSCYTNLEVQGNALTDGTMGVTGLTSLSTLNTSGRIAVATTSPSSMGNVVISGTGTTTLMLGSATALTGTCIQMLNSAGALTAVSINGTTVVAVAGSCK